MSNLIALKDANNDIGLGTSYIGLGTISGTTILPFKKDDGTSLMSFNTSNNSINLGTISSGTWEGTVIGTSYGGLGAIGIGDANQVLKVNSSANGLIWADESGGSNANITTSTNIATSASSAVGLGSSSQDLTINTSSLNINIGNTAPTNGQILKYNGTTNSLSWQNNATTSINNLFNLMNAFHPGYILLLKSLDVQTGIGTTTTTHALNPIYDVNTTNYTVNIGSNYSASILPTLFSSSVTVKINNAEINVPNIYYIDSYTSPTSFNITTNSGNSSKTYALNISRDVLTDANLKSMSISSIPSLPTSFNYINESTTSYDIDVLSNLTSFTMIPQVHTTASFIGIGTYELTKSSGIGTSIVTGIGIGTNVTNSIIDKTITPIDVVIKAEDTTTTKAYTFNISRPPRNTTSLSSITITIKTANDNTTADRVITISNPDSSIEYNKDNSGCSNLEIPYEYPREDDGPPSKYDTIHFNMVRNHNNQTVTINNTNFNFTGNHGLELNDLPDSVSTKTYSIKVTAPNGTTTSTYKITVNRLSSESHRLNSIIIKNTDSSGTDILTNYNPLINSYDFKSTKLYATATDIYIKYDKFNTSQTVKLYIDDDNNNDDNTYNSNTQTYSSETTTNTSNECTITNTDKNSVYIRLRVTAANGTNNASKDYIFYIAQYNNTLQSITYDNIGENYPTINSPGIYNLGNTIQTSLNLNNTPRNKSTVTISGSPEELIAGVEPYNQIIINVKSEYDIGNSNEGSNYIINVYKKSNDTTINEFYIENYQNTTNSTSLTSTWVNFYNESVNIIITTTSSKITSIVQNLDDKTFSSTNTSHTLNQLTLNPTYGNPIEFTVTAEDGTTQIYQRTPTDTTAPTVDHVTSQDNDNDTYTIGETIAIWVVFTETVVVTGTPQLTLETGDTDAVVNYTIGTGSDTLKFDYTVATGHTSSRLDYKDTTALKLNGGTIKDVAGNNAILTLATPQAAGSLWWNKGFEIDGIVPTVDHVTSDKDNDTYTIGETISILVVFTETVVVTGTPQLTLETGDTDAVVNYTIGTGSDTLKFDYTVATGHTSSRLDYKDTTALKLNGGTIKNVAGNNAILTLATPQAAGSLWWNKDFEIDTTLGTLDDSEDVIVAYALRRLFNDYSGPIVRVKNSSNVQSDIYFDKGGLIIEPLPVGGTFSAYNNGNDVEIIKVYDQSGNGDHLTPTNLNPYLKYTYSTAMNNYRYAIYFGPYNTGNTDGVRTLMNDTINLNNFNNNFNSGHTIITAFEQDDGNAFASLFAIGAGSYTGAPTGGGNNKIVGYHPTSNAYHENTPFLFYWNADDREGAGLAGNTAGNGWVSSNNPTGKAHIAYRYNKNTPHRSIEVFKESSSKIDIDVSTNTLNTYNKTSNLNITHPYLYLGDDGRAKANFYPNTYKYKGSIFHFLVYNTPLSDSSITSISNKLVNIDL